MIIIDFETRSECNLLTDGTYKYTADPSTEILCMSFAWDDGKNVYSWVPRETLLPDAFLDYLKGDGLIAAHNAEFDMGIWNNAGVALGLPHMPIERWYCTAAACRVNAIPASLNNATRATKVAHTKNPKGTALIKAMSIPPYEHTPALMREMITYCEEDVKATRALLEVLRPMTQAEHADWVVSTRISANGLVVDRYLASKAVNYAADETRETAKLLTGLTDGAASKHTQSAKLRDWVLANYPPARDIMTVTKHDRKTKTDKTRLSFDRTVRAKLLIIEDLPQDVRTVIELTDAANKSSVSKFGNMLAMSDDEGVMRGAFVYFGASQTGRFSSKGVQVHNYPRECMTADEAEDVLDLMENGEGFNDTMRTLTKLLRPAIVPREGNVLVVNDWSSIEARVLPWLADSEGADQVLDVFDNDEDIYMHTAHAIGIEDRQIGKVANLSLGYQGALGAFKSMALNYGLLLPDAQVLSIVKRWRAANMWAVKFWDQLNRAACNAVGTPSTRYKAGRVEYIFLPHLLGGTLMALLPDGSCLQYPQARLEQDDRGNRKVSCMKAAWTPAIGRPDWPRIDLYGGSLAENLAQGVSACILRAALRELADRFTIVGHVHDEIICDVPEEEADECKALMKKVMETPPDWAEDLPMKAEPVAMKRYGK